MYSIRRLVLFTLKKFFKCELILVLIPKIEASNIFWVFLFRGCEILCYHYMLGFGSVCFSNLGFFPILVGVWGDWLFHTTNIEPMLKVVGVSM